MASLIGPKTDVALAEAAAAAGSEVGVCVVANDNNAGNVVISGDKAAVDRGHREGQGAGRARHPAERLGALPLPADAAGRRRDGRGAGRRRPSSRPRAPLVANVTARPTSDPEAIRRLLVEQVTGRVRWRESMLWLAGEGGRHPLRRGRRRQGADRHGQAHRARTPRPSPLERRPADLEAFAAIVAMRSRLHVRPYRQDRPRHRRHRRHRRRHRPRPARPGRHVVLSGTREAVLEDLAGELGERRLRRRRQPVRRRRGRRPGRPRPRRPPARRSTSWSPTPASPGRPADADEGRGLGDGDQGQPGEPISACRAPR